MSMRSNAQVWGSVTRALHWISAALILFGLIHGYWMANVLARPERLPHYKWHSIVFLYFGLLLLLRIVWRLQDHAPDDPKDSKPWERAAAHLGHFALYALMIALVVTGYMNWSAFPARFDAARAPMIDLYLLGGWKVPALHSALNRDIFKFWETAHMYLAWAMAALVVVHVLAALRHHLLKGNNVLRRMLSANAAT